MKQHDDTNRGVLFKTKLGGDGKPNKRIVMDGNIFDGEDIAENKMNIIMVEEKWEDKTYLNLYTRIGTLYKNDMELRDSSYPNYGGNFKDKRISGWVNGEGDQKRIRLSLSEKRQQHDGD